MASYPAPTNSLSVFNPSNYDATYDADTISYGDTRYLVKSSGGTVSGNTTFTKALCSGTGNTTTLTYWEGINSSFSSSYAKFGTHSLYCPYTTHNSGLTVTSSGVFNATNFASAWTIELWYYPIATSDGVLVSNFGNACNGGYIQLSLSTSTVYASWFNWTSGTGGGAGPLLSGTITTGSWNHIAFGYNGSTKYFLGVNGTYTDTSSAVVMDYSEIFQNGNSFSFGNGMYFNTTDPVLQYPVNGYIDEIRFSKVQRYTANYTAPTSAFASDANTFFLHHLNGSLIDSQETPSVTNTSGGLIVDGSGNLTLSNGITSTVGGFSTVTGDIQTTRGQLRCYDTISTTQGAWRLGSNTVLNGTSVLSASTTVGCYVVNGSWTAWTNSSHLISHLNFLMNTSNTNVLGKFIVYASSKAGGGTKMGLVEFHYYLQSGSTAVVYTMATTKSASLSTLTVAVSSTKNITVSTDSDIRICWTAQMCI